MAIPLKNGADLYNFEVLRMRFHNLGADPTSDFGVGQVYFNTSTSEGSGKRVRIYDGSAFRSLAYFDEIDKRLKLIEGSVDTSELINNLEDVQNFLRNIEESDGDLMTMLSGKLDTAGGTIEIDNLQGLIVNRTNGYNSAITFKGHKSTSDSTNSILGYLGFSGLNNPCYFSADGTGNTLLHSGNVGEYKAGGISRTELVVNNDISVLNNFFGNSIQYAFATGISDIVGHSDGLILNIPHSSKYGQQWFLEENNHLIKTRYNDGGKWSAWKTLAFTDSNVASATKLETPRTIWGRSFDGTGNITGPLELNNNVAIYCKNTSGLSKDVLKISSSDSFIIGYGVSEAGHSTYLEGNNVFLRYGQSHAKGLILNSSGNVTIGDSDLAGDRKLYVAGKGAFIGSDSKEVQVTVGNTVNQVQLGVTNVGVAYMFTRGAYDMIFSTSGTRRMTITAGGNVLIGTTTDDGSGAKLQVNGTSCFSKAVLKKTSSLYRVVVTSSEDSLIFGDDASTTFFRGSEMAFQNKTGGKRAMTILWNDGDPRVGMGISTPTEKLHVVGNLLVEGNIIATGEVSAGGAGEEGDTGTGTGGGDALIYSQEFTPTTTSITITHNLSATKGVIVQVWEKNGNYWDMVLVDVEEVDTNTVTLFFGKTETTVHKVVIMG